MTGTPLAGSPTAVQRERRSGPAWLIVLGAAAVIASFVRLDWYDTGNRAADTVGDSRFTDLRHNVDAVGGTPIAGAYFDWLGWALLGAVVVLGIAACLGTRASDPLRVAGFVTGLAGVVATFYALGQMVHAQGLGTSSIWRNSGFGLWLTVAGFAAAALGAGLGPRVTRSSS